MPGSGKRTVAEPMFSSRLKYCSFRCLRKAFAPALEQVAVQVAHMGFKTALAEAAAAYHPRMVCMDVQLFLLAAGALALAQPAALLFAEAVVAVEPLKNLCV